MGSTVISTKELHYIRLHSHNYCRATLELVVLSLVLESKTSISSWSLVLKSYTKVGGNVISTGELHYSGWHCHKYWRATLGEKGTVKSTRELHQSE